MKIIGIDVHRYSVGYAHGVYVMSGGRAASEEDGTVVRLRTDEGLDGWGEITTLGMTYLPTFPAGIRAALAELGPYLLGLDPTHLSRVHEVMDAVLLGQGFAKSAVDVACWDLAGKAVGRPVSHLLGGVLQDRFPLYEAVPLLSPEEMAQFVTDRRAVGTNRFQLKVGNDPRDDARRAQACVEAGDDDTIVVADSNGGWSLASAKVALHLMADLPIFVEQPCRSTTDCVLAHRGSTLPLVLDESVTDATELYRAKFEAGAVSVNLKLGRLGGLTRTALVRDLMQELGLLVSVEDMWGGDIVTAAVSHLAASTKPGSLLMTSFFNDWTDGHLAGHHPRSERGYGSAPTGPGLGIEVDLARLGEPVLTFSA